MRKRLEIGYLTFLGLSLTVVVTACNDRFPEISSFSLSNASNSHTKALSSTELADFLKASQQETSTFVFEDKCLFHKALLPTTQLLVDVGQGVVLVSSIPHEFSTFYPDRLVGLLSSVIYNSELSFLVYKYSSERNHLISADLFTVFLARAGPYSC